MEPVITEKQDWVVIDGPEGTEWIPFESIDEQDFNDLVEEVRQSGSAHIGDTSLGVYVENSIIYDIDVVTGYGAYFSSPGYLDRTETVVFDTEEEAEDYIQEEEDYLQEEEGGKKIANKTGIIGFAYSDDTVFRKVNQRQFDRLVSILEDGGDVDTFVIDELKSAKVSSEEEAVAILYMRNPDVEWLKERWMGRIIGSTRGR